MKSRALSIVNACYSFYVELPRCPGLSRKHLIQILDLQGNELSVPQGQFIHSKTGVVVVEDNVLFTKDELSIALVVYRNIPSYTFFNFGTIDIDNQTLSIVWSKIINNQMKPTNDRVKSSLEVAAIHEHPTPREVDIKQ